MNAPANYREAAPVFGRGMLMVLTDLPSGEEAEINEWYNREHVPDRVPGVPGFRLAARYISASAGGSPGYMAYYETDTPDVLQSQPYLDLVANRDALTDSILPRFQNTIRTVGKVSAERRCGFGSHVAILPVTPMSGQETALRVAVVDTILPSIARCRGIVRTALIERDDAVLASSTRRHARQGDRSFDWVLLVDGTSAAAAGEAADQHRELIQWSGGAAGTPLLFQLVMFAAA